MQISLPAQSCFDAVGEETRKTMIFCPLLNHIRLKFVQPGAPSDSSLSLPRSPHFASMLTHLSAAHNPYIGFFLDHVSNANNLKASWTQWAMQILLEAEKRQMALVQEAAQCVLNVWTSTWAFALICLWDVLYGILIILVWNGSGFLNTLLTIQDFVVNTQNTKNRIQSYTYTHTQSQLKPCCSLYFNDTCRERTLQDCAQRQFFVPPKLTCHGGQAAALGLDFACPSCPNRKCGKSSQWDIPREIVWSRRLRQWSESLVPGGHFKAPSASRASWEACSNCHVLLTCSVLRSNKDEPKSAII